MDIVIKCRKIESWTFMMGLNSSNIDFFFLVSHSTPFCRVRNKGIRRQLICSNSVDPHSEFLCLDQASPNVWFQLLKIVYVY